ncbi:MAG: Tex family protein [Candidatus Xenobia bacterium]
MKYVETIAAEVNRSTTHVANVLTLLNDGSTVPFIARYRKEMTGSMDEDVIRAIRDRWAALQELDARKSSVLGSIEEQGKLSPELRQAIERAATLQMVEDLYLPYKPKRRTRGQVAREKGLEPLAQAILQGRMPQASAEDLAGASDIIAEDLSDDAPVRQWLRQHVWRNGLYVSKVTKEFAGQRSKFEAYYDYRKAVRDIPLYTLLALRRGEEEKVLKVHIEVEAETVVAWLSRRLGPGKFLADVAADAWSRLLKPSITNEVDAARKAEADKDAIRTFAVNLRNLLLASPAGEKVVLGIDPGFRTGCKVAVVDRSGRYLENATIYPTEPRNDEAGAARVLLDMIRRHQVELIAIGNGTGGRETEAFVGRTLAVLDPKPLKVLVSEAGASVYSASPVAKAEFPELDVTIRGAISIARRLQDPLAELVKIEPQSIGVGQYQHDVDQKDLGRALEGVVESCVNYVGVDLNTASAPLLAFISGINATLARNVVAWRDQHGPFRTRKALLDVPRFGPRAFEQAAGFLRIRGAAHPLDNSAVHPERYALVERIARDAGRSVQQLVGHVEGIEFARYAGDGVGMETLHDIREELLKPGRDPRQEFRYAAFQEHLQELKDLQPDMVLEGSVTNVTAFGAFVDVGVHQDGLVHKSELANRYVNDPSEVVRVGDIVKVKVLSVDLERKRVSLSMKRLT